MMKISQRRSMEEMEAMESHHPHPHHHHPLLLLQYISHTSQKTLVKVPFFNLMLSLNCQFLMVKSMQKILIIGLGNWRSI